jgi:hypothetical protein
MIDAMRLGLHIAGLASAAVLAAAMLFAPTAAQAHAGVHHGHHNQAHHAAAVAHEAVAPATATAEAVSSVRDQHVVASAHTSDSADQTGKCTDGCCGSGLGCCGAAALASPASLPEIAHRGVPFSFRLVVRTGIDPDGLKRPPRSLA